MATCTKCSNEAVKGRAQCARCLKRQRERNRAAMKKAEGPLTWQQFEAMQDGPLPNLIGIASPHSRFFACPKCGSNTATPTCRQTKVGFLRHKECPKCGYYFYTLDDGNGERFFHDRRNKAKHHKMHRTFSAICKMIADKIDNPPADTVDTLNRVAVACGLRAANPEEFFSK